MATVSPTPTDHDENIEVENYPEKPDPSASWKFLVACAIYLTIFSLLGGRAFQKLEKEADVEKLNKSYEEVRKSREKLRQFLNSEAQDALEEYESVLKLIEGPIQPYLGQQPPETLWDSYIHALSFIFALITTIGYGNMTPKTTNGKLFCVWYAMVGIPVMIIYIAIIGKLFARLCLTAYIKIFGKHLGLDYFIPRDASYLRKWFGMFISVSIIMSCLLGYMVLGAFLFDHSENWGFINSFYFCFTTLTTIGFGDFVPNSISVTYETHYALLRATYIVWGLAITSTGIELVRTHYSHIWSQINTNNQIKTKLKAHVSKTQDGSQNMTSLS